MWSKGKEKKIPNGNKAVVTLNNSSHFRGNKSHMSWEQTENRPKCGKKERGWERNRRRFTSHFTGHTYLTQKMQLHKRQISINVSQSRSKSACLPRIPSDLYMHSHASIIRMEMHCKTNTILRAKKKIILIRAVKESQNQTFANKKQDDSLASKT